LTLSRVLFLCIAQSGNISVGLEYIESWLRGVGCVPIHNLMEDAATAEICRSQRMFSRSRMTRQTSFCKTESDGSFSTLMTVQIFMFSSLPVWQWIRHGAQLVTADGKHVPITKALVKRFLQEGEAARKKSLGPQVCGSTSTLRSLL